MPHKIHPIGEDKPTKNRTFINIIYRSHCKIIPETRIIISNNTDIEIIPDTQITLKDRTIPKTKITLEDRIQNLPVELQRYIFKEYIELGMCFDIFQEKLNHEISQYLNTKYILPYIPLILARPLWVKYFSDHIIGSEGSKPFHMVYKMHKESGHKNFILVKKGESFALSLLMFLHH
jgi:hypothetical protein